MENKEALPIVRALAEGVDPESGDACPGESVFQQPNTIRALGRATEALAARVAQEERRRRLPENIGKPWDESEDAQLRAEYERGLSIWHISKIHGRTRGGISARLERLGKVPLRLFEAADLPRLEASPSPSSASGKPWLADDDQKLCAAFDQSHDFTVISTELGRYRAEVYQRLVKLGKIKPKAISSVA
ncbi:MAG TPA: hypothetical protein VKA07_08360 [Candidatus Sulfotelmatobacter sp.]|nr:hypothetical protein [Candidatus Sulfotelmatobacter sp.]